MGGGNIKRIMAVFITILLFIGVLSAINPISADDIFIMEYDDVSLSGGFQSGNFQEIWDLTECDLTLSFTVDLNGMVDDPGAHAWSEFGVRALGYGNFNPTWMVEGAGVWLATDYDWTANTFDPDPLGDPKQDLDDKLILQKGGGTGEGNYNLPSSPPNQWANHRVWFDRDGVDQWQAQSPLAVDGGTYNTGGTYDIVMTLHAIDDNNGTAYITINGLYQGFETDNIWSTMELTPAGMTFTGDMKNMQVFYGLYGYGATHSVTFSDITVEGCLSMTIPELRAYLPDLIEHKGLRRSIDAKLANAEKQFIKGKEKTADNVLKALVNHINDLIENGDLTEYQGELIKYLCGLWINDAATAL